MARRSPTRATKGAASSEPADMAAKPGTISALHTAPSNSPPDGLKPWLRRKGWTKKLGIS